MTLRGWRFATLSVAFVIIVGLGFAGTQARAAGKGQGNGSTTSNLPPPGVEIVIYDGTALPATTLVACSELDCLGWNLPPNQWTWEVTYPKNNVGWAVSGGDPQSRIYLYVDDKLVARARSGELLSWSTTGLASGSQHTVQGMAYNQAGVPGWSTPLTITVTH